MGVLQISALVALFVSTVVSQPQVSQPSLEDIQSYITGLTNFGQGFGDELGGGLNPALNGGLPVNLNPGPGEPIFGPGGTANLLSAALRGAAISEPATVGLTSILFPPDSRTNVQPLLGNGFGGLLAALSGVANGGAGGSVAADNAYNRAANKYDPKKSPDLLTSVLGLAKGVIPSYLEGVLVLLALVVDVIKAVAAGYQGIQDSTTNFDPETLETTYIADNLAIPLAAIGRAFYDRGPQFGTAMSRTAPDLVNVLGAVNQNFPYLLGLGGAAVFQTLAGYLNILGNSWAGGANAVREGALADPNNGLTYPPVPYLFPYYVNPVPRGN